MRRIRTSLAVIAMLAVAACSQPPHLETHGPGRIGIRPLKSYSALQSKALMWLAGLKGITAENTIDCYRIVYLSTDASGKKSDLSGLLALPHGVAPRGLVSYQHGTTSSRDSVPSTLDTNGLAAAILFAGNGYALIAPDYVGLGVSKGPHPYMVAADSARAVVDMIHAVRHIKGVPGSPPFLIGFSEGGYVSLAAQRALEAHHEAVLGTAAVAGAFNLRAISIPFELKGPSPNASTYLALWVRGYATRYGHPLDSALTPHYAALLPQLFDTPHEPDEVERALPRDPRAMFAPATLAALDGKGSHWLVDAMAENEMGDWAAQAPMRLYYGTADADVSPRESIVTAAQLAARGGHVQAINVGAVDHNESVQRAAPLIVTWLQALSQAPVARN
jgi:alpha-beta hydrolase superfamily lysophospholipase